MVVSGYRNKHLERHDHHVVDAIAVNQLDALRRDLELAVDSAQHMLALVGEQALG